MLERTELFKRSIGEFTDIVEKEMYTFVDRGGDSLTLRPEATAGIVRACLSNGLLHNQRQKLWCMGPMFRYERPQKGRYRQFHQIDVEALGFEGPDVDAELILMSARLWRRLGIGGVSLQLNSLGTPESRATYREQLVEYFRRHETSLDEDSRRRLDGNPLRILDSKNPAMREVVAGAPLITDHLDPDSAEHFDRLRAQLDDAGLAYTVNPRLVRGLDYYSRTVFEWITSDLGSQDAVCSGGRYDGLVAQLGGEPVPAIGWALGEERVVELMRLQGRADAEPDGGRLPRARRCGRRTRRAPAGGAAARRAAGPAHRNQLRRRQLQVAAQARRPQRRATCGDPGRRRTGARRGDLEAAARDDGAAPGAARRIARRAGGGRTRRRPRAPLNDAGPLAPAARSFETWKTCQTSNAKNSCAAGGARTGPGSSAASPSGCRCSRAGSTGSVTRCSLRSSTSPATVAVLEALGRNQRDEAASQAKALRERRPDSPYADQAELALARAALERRDFDDAAGLLRGVADRSKDTELRQTSRIRLARVLIEQGKHDEALVRAGCQLRPARSRRWCTRSEAMPTPPRAIRRRPARSTTPPSRPPGPTAVSTARSWN